MAIPEVWRARKVQVQADDDMTVTLRKCDGQHGKVIVQRPGARDL
jgi:hypothetical protein